MPTPDSNRPATKAFANLRRWLSRNPAVTRGFQVSRALIHFGPWRHAARSIIRVTRPPRSGAAQAPSTIVNLDPDTVVSALRKDGFCVATTLRPDLVQSLRQITNDLPPREYAHFHHDNPEVRALVEDDTVLAVVSKYLGSEPELLECTVVVHESEDGRSWICPQRRFHFDYAGWQSLNLFVYLTDVDEASGTHEIVAGTHRRKAMRDAVRPWVPDEEIERRFPGRIRSITGPAGTLFFEDTEAFHRRRAMKRRRVMLNVLYASHRGFLSHGRLAPSYRDYLLTTSAKVSAVVPAEASAVMPAEAIESIERRR